MRKFKTFLTILLLYEFAVLTILQIPNYCVGLFNVNFCNISFRYFLLCIVLPVSVCVFLWWLPDISKLFCPKNCRCNVQETPDLSLRNIIKEIVSAKDIERLISVAIIMGIRKFVDNKPRMQNIFDTVVGAIKKTPKIKK